MAVHNDLQWISRNRGNLTKALLPTPQRIRIFQQDLGRQPYHQGPESANQAFFQQARRPSVAHLMRVEFLDA
jgi:hypothetical protein